MKRTIFLLLIVFECAICLAQHKAKVACIGNSVTYGYGLNQPAETSYPAQLQRLLGNKYIVENFGHNGATLLRKGHRPYFKTDEFQHALDFHPDIVVIHLGLNDTDPRNWPHYRDEFATDYAWLIDTFRKINPHVKIYICKMTPIFSGHSRFLSGTRDWFWQIQRLIPKIAQANRTGFIDLHTPLYTRPNLFADYLHPNKEGAGIIAKSIYEILSGDYGGLKLSSVFGSHMVLQCEQPITFYGRANARQDVAVEFNGIQKAVETGTDGKWQVSFPPLSAGGPYKATFQSAETTITLEDILIGEVWLCSGQSNMYFPLSNEMHRSEAMRAAEKNQTLRFLNMQPIAETNDRTWDSITLKMVNELQYFSGKWQRCDSNSAKAFSAVAYYFGKQLQEKLGVPVGLIQVAVGGSNAESWIDRYTMEHDNLLVNELAHWKTSDFLMPWVRQRANKNTANAGSKLQRHPYQPCYNFDAGIRQFVDFPIAGAIWYQGASNAHNLELYEKAFPALVKSWRSQWGYNFPFYYVQLSSIHRTGWAWFRLMQSGLLKVIPNSGMAVSSDVGDPYNVHPVNKKPVGERLARLALHYTYGMENIVPSGPIPLSAVKSGNQIIITFRYGKMLRTSDGKELRGFKLRDEKGFLMNVKALISKGKVVIPFIQNAEEVLYGWAPYTDANLVNGSGLPAATFRIKIQY